MEITLIQGDITEQRVDAVVNAANSSLLGGGGVRGAARSASSEGGGGRREGGAIHRKGGPEVLAACRALRASHYGKGLKVGQAVATTAGKLPATWVIHTVGPVYAADDPARAALLASCYRESLRVAEELGVRTLALPAVSAGIYGWPLEDAARIALTTVREAGAGSGLEEARFVLFGAEAYQAFDSVRREWDEGRGLGHGSMVD